jgi:catabolite repression protein CreC
MEIQNESTFVAPEGVYSITEEHKPLVHPHGTQITYPTKLSTVLVKYPTIKSATPGLAQLLNVGKRDTKEAAKEDGISLSSSDTPDEADANTSTQENGAPASPQEHTALFSNSGAVKKKQTTRPKHSIRNTSSTFISRVQSAEGGSKALHSKQGDTTFVFYNCGKTFVWVDAGSKSKVSLSSHIWSS